jgi:RNA polymerase-binding transcription factor DksA
MEALVDESKLRSILEQEKERLQALQRSLTEDDDQSAELSTVDQHPADVGSEVFEREKDLAIADNFGFQLDEIEAALKRLGTDAVGRCETCGKVIQDARLEAIPWTRFCVEHQAEFDQTG